MKKKAIASLFKILLNILVRAKKCKNPQILKYNSYSLERRKWKSYGIYKITNKITCAFNNVTRYKVTVRKEIAFCY